MDMSVMLRLLPTAEMIAEELSLMDLNCESHISDSAARYCNVRLFTGQEQLQTDILYALRPGETRFPSDCFSYICTTPISGKANHLYCPDQSAERILDALMELFFRFQQTEMQLDQLLFRNGSLNELCELGAALLDNPVFIHDDWFIIIGMSQENQPAFNLEHINNSRKVYVPKDYIEGFKYDSDYTKSYSYPDAQLWRNPDGTPATLYVNLWDGAVFRGRLIVLRQTRDFRKSDYLISEILTQRAMMILRSSRGVSTATRGMDDRVLALLEGRLSDESDLSRLLDTLDWEKHHRYLCVRLKPQDPAPNILMDHMLHSDLFHAFPNSYILFAEREQCVIVNLTQLPQSLIHLRHTLAPLCRDYCLYAGISSPVRGIRDLHLSYYQAQVALNQAFFLHSEKWIIPFSDCILEHILGSLRSPLSQQHLVNPDLYTLMHHDQEKDTQYLQTLRTWLLLERSIPETSQALIIHRSTLLYRLKKIQGIIGSNLDDPWQRLNLLLSFWILEHNPQRQN